MMKAFGIVCTCMAMTLMATAPARCGSDGSDTKTGTDIHAQHAHAVPQAKVGMPAPAFSLKGIDGKTHSLSDYKGKVVVLEWTNHKCPVVKRCHAAKLMTKTLTKFKGQPVVWLAINSTHADYATVDAIGAWAKEVGVTYPILLDAPGKVGHAYGAKTTPHMFVIDQKGVLAYAGALDNDPYGDKESGVRNYVEEAVKALLHGSTVKTANTKPYGCGVKYQKS